MGEGIVMELEKNFRQQWVELDTSTIWHLCLWSRIDGDSFNYINN